ncbi:uncharacterized protein LOC112194478 [Rosa chinensis]|uniref:uncharacterized protein LOC112194478 n=1 Tax=Rosa chinensis TaxID=74649 RepID=UPI000D0895F7|nr:uncharacterized protein LOC112194478 [Rosa chinensis]
MGFRDMHCFNLALLAKQGWRLVQKPNTLIAQLLKAKYFPTCSFMEAELKKGASYTWRSIIAGRAVLQKGMRIQVGDGATISLWDDPWVPVPYSFRPFSTVMEGTESWRVADVIDYEDKEWLTDVLGELFTRGEVATIASIPLNCVLVGVGAGRTPEDILDQNLDVACVFCKSTNESSLHVFKECDALQCFWRLGPLKLKAKEQAAGDLKNWLFDVLDMLNSNQVDFFFMALWSVWTERNKIVWNDGCFQPMHMIQWCTSSLEEFQKYHQKVACKKKRPLTKWQCPPRGRLKINIDGAFQVDSGVGGIGVVVRDDLGTGIAAIARPFLHAHSAINMEAEACRAGLLLGIHQGWSDVVIESDSALLIAALKSEEDNFSEHGVQVLCPPVAKF